MSRRSKRVVGKLQDPSPPPSTAGIRRYLHPTAGTLRKKMAPAGDHQAAAQPQRSGKGEQQQRPGPPTPPAPKQKGGSCVQGTLSPLPPRDRKSQQPSTAAAGKERCGLHSPPPHASPPQGSCVTDSAAAPTFVLGAGAATQGSEHLAGKIFDSATGHLNDQGAPSQSLQEGSGSMDSVTTSASPPLNGQCSTPPMSASPTNDFLDLRAQLAAIPTKSDMEGYIQRLELAYKSEIQALTNNVSQLTDQVHRIDGDLAAVTTHQTTQDRAIAQNTQHIHMLFSIAEDHENRNRRNNVRIRGVPETVTTPNILPTIRRFFNDLLGNVEDAAMEIDRAHRTLGPKNPDPNRPRDILCRLHYFTVKELILRRARERGDLFLDGTKIQLLSDLSKMTLDKRRALRPLLDALRDHDYTYSWGYPFQLQVRVEGAMHCVRSPADVPDFCAALGLPAVPVGDWPYTPLPPQRPLQRRRGRSPPPPRDRRWERRPARPDDQANALHEVDD